MISVEPSGETKAVATLLLMPCKKEPIPGPTEEYNAFWLLVLVKADIVAFKSVPVDCCVLVDLFNNAELEDSKALKEDEDNIMTNPRDDGET